MRWVRWFAIVVLCMALPAAWPGQRPEKLGPEVQKYVRYDAPRVVLTHVRVIDGMGSPAVEDRNVVIQSGKIAAIEAGADVTARDGQVVLNLRGETVIPGWVGMHNHLFYAARPNLAADGTLDAPTLVLQMTFSAPLLYLAGGVTTMRTTGSVEPYADLNLKQMVDEGQLAGPHLDVTGPNLEGAGGLRIEMHPLSGPEDARQFVNYWANQGATSFKAYMNITREELKAAIEEAHRRGIKVTGHVCAVTYPEAAGLGIDDLEHGFFFNTQLDPGKQPDQCPKTMGQPTLMAMEPGGPVAKELIAKLVEKHVALTSTLAVLEHTVPNRPALQQRVLDVMTPGARERFLLARNINAAQPAARFAAMLRREMDLEREFVAAGGLLMTGTDPTGDGGTVPGFGDQRGVELLVEAGFTPVEAIRIATYNGALYLGRQEHIGSIAVGKNADLVVVRGNPAARIEDIENVEVVFKDGTGYDPAELLAAVRGHYGEY
jgi:imidazolonepropionase-like amidohydrolase